MCGRSLQLRLLRAGTMKAPGEAPSQQLRESVAHDRLYMAGAENGTFVHGRGRKWNVCTWQGPKMEPLALNCFKTGGSHVQTFKMTGLPCTNVQNDRAPMYKRSK